MILLLSDDQHLLGSENTNKPGNPSPVIKVNRYKNTIDSRYKTCSYMKDTHAFFTIH